MRISEVRVALRPCVQMVPVVYKTGKMPATQAGDGELWQIDIAVDGPLGSQSMRIPFRVGDIESRFDAMMRMATERIKEQLVTQTSRGQQSRQRRKRKAAT